MNNLIGRRTTRNGKKVEEIELRILEDTEIEDSESYFSSDTILEFMHAVNFINGMI